MASPALRHKHVRIDQTKLEKAKKVLDARTDTEAIDGALSLVVSEAEIDTALRRIGGKGKLKTRPGRVDPIVMQRKRLPGFPRQPFPIRDR
jgi:hypothetical protein